MFKNISIRNKLILIQLATALIAVLICCVIFVINDIKIFKNTSINNKYSIAEIVGVNAIAPLLFNDSDAAHKILLNLSSNSSILNVVIFDKTGKPFARYNKTGEIEYSFQEKDNLQSELLEGQRFIVDYKIFQGKEYLGSIWMRCDLPALNSIVSGYVKIGISVLIIAILATLIISIFFQRIITKPLFAFVKKAKEVSDNADYSVRVLYTGKDEIGALSVEFNYMLSQIQKMEKSLKEINSELEKRVKARTRELETTNKELQLRSSELMRSNLELEQFAYIASHDLQEPLRTISNFVGLFKKQFIENKFDNNSSQYLEYILGATERMQTLIVDLLSYSRIGHYKNLYSVDCNQVVQEVLNDFDSLIKSSGAKIEIEKLPLVNAHYSEIKSLFQNLISNAIKFRKKNAQPTIRISSKEEDKDWLFAVQDDGIGINELYRDKLFKIFQRLHSQNEFSGTGIGLAQCKKIVELLGGKIWVDSKPGKGSIFYFTIPK
jgi:signal transduction histidine kinase